MKAPLPPDWKPCQTENGEIYYFNFKTGNSIWDHPCDEYYKKVYEDEKKKRDSARQNISSKSKSNDKDSKKKEQKALAPLKSERISSPITLNSIVSKAKLGPVKSPKSSPGSTPKSKEVANKPTKSIKIPISQTVLGPSGGGGSSRGKGGLSPLKDKEESDKEVLLNDPERLISEMLDEQKREMVRLKNDHEKTLKDIKSNQEKELQDWKEKANGENERQKNAIAAQKKVELEQLRKFYSTEREKLKEKLTLENKKEIEQHKLKLKESLTGFEKTLLMPKQSMKKC